MTTSTPIRRGLGITAGLDAGLARALAVQCERLGYHSLWSNDEPTSSGLETLAQFAAAAPQLELGVGVLPLDRWSRGSVLLVGDAAHATSPNMAEGAAMALEDGLVLAECLASGRGIAQTVATFQARRRPRTQWVLAQTHRRDRTRSLPPALRNLVLRRWGQNIFHANYRPLLELP